MNDILKQRLVGALILVALGIVFWPIIFVEPGERAALEQSRIPLPPRIDRSPIESPQQGALRASPEWEPGTGDRPDELSRTPLDEAAEPVIAVNPDAESPAEAASAGATYTRANAPDKPELDSMGVPVAWILQVASVSSAAKADELRDRLLAINEKAYIKRIERGEKDLYRVYIGPNFERAQLEKIQASVDSQFQVSSMIVRYVP